MHYSTFENAKLLNATFASVGCTNWTIAVIPDGGSSTLSRSPNFPNVFLISSTLVPWGKFFTRITVLLFLALAYKRENELLEETHSGRGRGWGVYDLWMDRCLPIIDLRTAIYFPSLKLAFLPTFKRSFGRKLSNFIVVLVIFAKKIYDRYIPVPSTYYVSLHFSGNVNDGWAQNVRICQYMRWRTMYQYQESVAFLY